MARKSNKTAHVLNLLSGHDAAKDADEQTSAVENTSDDAASAAPVNAAQPVPGNGAGQAASSSGTAPVNAAQPAVGAAAVPPPVPAPAAPSQNNIAVIDKTEDDPVAELIQQNLSKEFEKQMQQSQPENLMPGEAEPLIEAEPLPEAEPLVQAEPLVEAEPLLDAKSILEAEPLLDSNSEPLLDLEPEPLADSESESLLDSDSEPLADLEPESLSDSEPEPLTDLESEPLSDLESEPLADSEPVLEAEPASAPGVSAVSNVAADDGASLSNTDVPEPQTETVPEVAPEPEPEDDFAAVNVMEHIVKDKIIYFMRQFDVCTCSRCKADVTALTLNGLMPKYIVTMKAAVDPLLSLYTNRLISDVTVEATKACMVVKENPRH